MDQEQDELAERVKAAAPTSVPPIVLPTGSDPGFQDTLRDMKLKWNRYNVTYKSPAKEEMQTPAPEPTPAPQPPPIPLGSFNLQGKGGASPSQPSSSGMISASPQMPPPQRPLHAKPPASAKVEDLQAAEVNAVWRDVEDEMA